MKSCMTTPSKIWWRKDSFPLVQPKSDNVEETYLKQPAWLKFYTSEGMLRLGSIVRSNPKYGFLGRPLVTSPANAAFNTYNDFNFKRCSTMLQCYEQDFFVYGYKVQRKIKRPGSNDGFKGIDYVFGDQFNCGGFGYKSSPTQCKLDLSVNAMYRVLCYSESSRQAILDKCRGNLMKSGLQSSEVVGTYCTPTWTSLGSDGIPVWSSTLKERELTDIANKLNALSSSTVNLWTPFLSTPSAIAYMNGAECANTIYTEIKATAEQTSPVYVLERKTSESDGREYDSKVKYGGMSLYYFSFTGMYEYPLSWFYKCALQAGGPFASKDSIYCDAWKNKIDVGTTATASVPPSMWSYLARLNGGIKFSDYLEFITSQASMWSSMVDTTFDSINQGAYFDDVDARGKYVRTCSSRREISRYYVDQSTTFASELKRTLYSNMDGEGSWPTIFASYDKCAGAFYTGDSAVDPQNSKQPCTVGVEKTKRASDVNDMKSKVQGYFKALPISQAYDFIQQSGSYSFFSESLPVMQFTNIAQNPADKNTLLISETRLSNFPAVGNSNCIMQAMKKADDKECFLKNDDAISKFERENPQYKLTKGKKPYVIATWGSNNPHAGTWPVVEALYNGKLPVSNSAIITPSDIESGFAGDLNMPDLGVGVMDVTTKGWKLDNTGSREEMLDTPPNIFCSLYEHDEKEPNYRDDICSNTLSGSWFGASDLGQKMKECPIQGSDKWGISQRDYNHGQACVPQSQCMWASNPKKLIKSKYWNFDFFRDWRDVYNGFNNDDQFYAKDIWRWTLDPRHVTEFYLPIGVFLQTFRPQLVDADCQYCSSMDLSCKYDNNVICNYNDGTRQKTVTLPSKASAKTPTPILWYTETQWFQNNGGKNRTMFWNRFDYRPDAALGMWPMCPHGYTDGQNNEKYIINEADKQKSQMLAVDDVIDTNYLYKRPSDLFTVPTWLPRHPWIFYPFFTEKYLSSSYWEDSTIMQTLPFHPTVASSANALMSTQYMCVHSNDGMQKCTVRNGYLNFRVGLAPGYIINDRLCGKLQFPYPVWDNIKRCVDCTWWTPRYCSGQHECRFPIVSNGRIDSAWRPLTYVPQYVKDKMASGDKDASVSDLNGAENSKTAIPQWNEKYLNDVSALRGLVALTGHFLLEKNGGTNKKFMNVQPLPIYTEEKENWNATNPFESYNPSSMIAYEDSLPMQASENDPNGKRCSGTRKIDGKDETVFQVNYRACNFSSNYQRLIDVVGSQSNPPSSSVLREKEGIILPAYSRLAYFTSKPLMIANGIPAWSRSSRTSNEIFVQNLLNSSAQCSYGNKQESICSLNNNQLYIMNPW